MELFALRRKDGLAFAKLNTLVGTSSSGFWSLVSFWLAREIEERSVKAIFFSVSVFDTEGENILEVFKC